MTIPTTADWLSAYQKTSGAAGSSAPSNSQARALAHADSVKIEILQSDGTTPVISPVTTYLYNSGPGNTSSTTLQLIPIGTNYNVKVSVYNSNTSSTVPVVIGMATGVVITQNATTSLTIKCLPNNPTTLTVGTPVAPSLANWAEKWYSASVSSGTTYYISQSTGNCIVGIFDGTGTYIASNASYLSYTATYTGTLYLVAVNNGSSAATASVNVSTSAPVLNEGSIASPVSLALDTIHTFKTGPSASQGSSYYSFTATSGGSYALDTAYGNYTPSLFSDAGFTTLVGSASIVNYGRVFTGLTAATAYYLRLTNNTSSSSLSITGQIVDPAAISSNTESEGSKASPVALTLGSSWAGKVGGHVYNANSYYKFTTGAGVNYHLSLASIAPSLSSYVSVLLYSDSAYTTQVASYNASSVNGFTTDLSLTPSTTYYLLWANSPANGALTYSLSVSGFTPTYANLSTDGSWTSGSVAASGATQWYSATVVGGQSYIVNWDGQYDGSGSYTLDPSVTAYQQDGITAYFSNQEYGYSQANTRVITVPAGQTTIIIKVTASYNGLTGTYALKLGVKPASGSLTITID